jgi:hypothetical protein
MTAAKILQMLPAECAVIPYGSVVYGTATEKSDIDLQIILRDKDFKKEDWKNKLAQRNFDLHVWSQSEFTEALNDHRVYAMECIHWHKQLWFRDGLNFAYKPSKTKLREEFSRVASNSWVKAKKKLIVEADYNEYIAKKSIFHSFRILDFGIQIAESGGIIDYGSMNHIFEELMLMPADWDIIDDTFRERHNKLASEFREACPKKSK